MTLETIELAPGYRITRMYRGCWQLAGAHGPIDRARATQDQLDAAESGITAFDCADIYTGVEELLGDMLKAYAARHGKDAAAKIKIHTKYIPDAELLPTIKRADTIAIIERSMQRLGRERLDLVQFHWWRYDVPRSVEVAGWLVDLQREGKIDLIGSTNFNTANLALLLDAGIPIVTHQAQYSILDDRAAGPMTDLCKRTGMRHLCFGTLAGGLISEKWLGQPDPGPELLTTRSHVKYKNIIDEIGGWDLFQAILRALKAVGDRHGGSIANVATRWMLDTPYVAGVIVGATSGDRHLKDNLKITAMKLDDRDRAEIGAVLAQKKPVPRDIWDEERDPESRHGFSGTPYTKTITEKGR